MRGGVSGRISRGTRVRGRGISTDLNVDIQSAVEFTVGDGTRNIERTIYDDMSDAESDPDDEYEEEEGDEIMLEFMSTN